MRAQPLWRARRSVLFPLPSHSPTRGACRGPHHSWSRRRGPPTGGWMTRYLLKCASSSSEGACFTIVTHHRFDRLTNFLLNHIRAPRWQAPGIACSLQRSARTRASTDRRHAPAAASGPHRGATLRARARIEGARAAQRAAGSRRIGEGAHAWPSSPKRSRRNSSSLRINSGSMSTPPATGSAAVTSSSSTSSTAAGTSTRVRSARSAR